METGFSGKLFIAFLGSILGFCSALAVRWWEERRRLKRIKEVTELYLKKEVSVNLPLMIKEYERCSKMILDYSNPNEPLEAFEGFNDNLYKAIKPEDYYKIYENNFIILSQIFSIIEFLSEALPSVVHFDFVKENIEHFKSENIKGEERKKHFQTCPHCINLREKYNKIFQLRIEECKILDSKIKSFTG